MPNEYDEALKMAREYYLRLDLKRGCEQFANAILEARALEAERAAKCVMGCWRHTHASDCNAHAQRDRAAYLRGLKKA